MNFFEFLYRYFYFFNIKKPYYAFFVKDCINSIKQADVLLVRHDNDCPYIYKDRIYCPLIDSVGFFYKRSGYKVQSIALPFSKFKLDKTMYNAITINFRYLNTIAKCKLMYFFDYLNCIENQRVKLWLDILNRVNPKIVIAIQPSFYLNKACNILKIPVYDLQHGLIDSSIRLYNKAGKRDYLPAGFLLWNKDSKKLLIDKFPYLKTFVIGHPFLYRFLKNLSDDDLIKEAKDKYLQILKGKINILITLQWGLKYHYSFLDFDILPKQLYNVIKKTYNSYNYLIRIHPVMLRDNYYVNKIKQLFYFLPQENIIDISNAPLPLVLQYTNLHITYSSSVFLESSLLNIKTIFLAKELVEKSLISNLYFKLDKNLVLTDLNEEKIYQAINNNLVIKRGYVGFDYNLDELLRNLMNKGII